MTEFSTANSGANMDYVASREEINRRPHKMPRAVNPYPEKVFPMTVDEAGELVEEYLQERTDAVFGAWGRYVWDMAIKAQCKLLIERGWVKGGDAL